MPAESAAGPSWSSEQLAVLTGKVDDYRLTGKLHGTAKKQARKELLMDVYKALKPLYPRQAIAEWAEVKTVCDTGSWSHDC